MIQRLLIIAAGIIRKLKLNRQIAVIADILQGLDYRGIIADAASRGDIVSRNRVAVLAVNVKICLPPSI